MKTKYLFGAALLATAFTACTDEFLAEQNFANQENASYLSENFVLGVSLGDEVESRANWAGEEENKGTVGVPDWVTKSVFSNVYFSPAYASTADAAAIELSNQAAIKGDQVGLSLISNNKAIANIPFFIAGYESNARLTAGSTAPAVIYPLTTLDAAQIAAGTDLYYLGAEEATQGKTALEYDNKVAQTLGALKTAVTMAARGTWTAANEFDPTKGLFKCHIPVMSGTYFAYFPFDKTLLTQGNIPAPTLDAFQPQAASADKTYAAGKMFAYSSEMQNFDHTKVSGQFKMDKNAAVIFQVKLQNYAATAPAAKTIKLVTISAEGDDDAFVLDGEIGFNGTTASFVDGTKTTGIMGVALNGTTGLPVAGHAATEQNPEGTPVTAYIAAYPKADAAGAIVIRAYTTDGKVFEKKMNTNISSYKPGSNKSPIIKMNLAALEEEVAENLAYDETTLKAAIAINTTEVINVKLLGEITTDEAVFASATNKKFNFEGGSLKFTTAAISALPAEVTFECPVTIENNWTIANSQVVFNGGVTNEGTMSVSTKANVSATTFNNAGGSLTVGGTAGDGNAAVFSATTLDNAGTVTVNAYSTFTVPTINNKKVTDVGTGNLNVNNALAGTAVEISNEAGTTLNWGVAEIPSALTLTNAGTFDLQCSETVTMKGATIINSGKIAIKTNKRLDIATGTLNNSGTISVNGVLNILQAATVTNTGSLREVGALSGYNFITNSGDNAKMIKVVETAEAFIAANNKAPYTAIEVNTAITNLNVTNVTKDIIMNANLSFNAQTVGSNPEALATEVANIYVNKTAELGANAEGLKCSNIVIEPLGNSNVKLTVVSGVVKVTGKIETKKTAKETDPVTYSVGNFAIDGTASVYATDIVTNDLTWSSYPEYGTTVE